MQSSENKTKIKVRYRTDFELFIEIGRMITTENYTESGIAKQLGLSNKTMKKHIAILSKLGLIEKKKCQLTTIKYDWNGMCWKLTEKGQRILEILET